MVAEPPHDEGYVIRIVDENDPNKVVGYAFAEHVSFVAADDSDPGAAQMASEAARLFRSRAPKLKAIALPGRSKASRKFAASEAGSGHRSAMAEAGSGHRNEN